MRSAELSGCQVYDRDGVRIGAVHDVRIEAAGAAYQSSGTPAYRICGLVVGVSPIGERLGYGRGRMAGPWPLDHLFRTLARRSLFVPWSDITCFERPRVEISSKRDELRSVLEVDQSEGGAG